MNGGPTIIERQALGNLLMVLQRKGESNHQWKNFIARWFEDWSPICNSTISSYDYYKTLKEFPTNGKREIIRGVLLGWNEHHDTSLLYNTINALIYLKVCNTVEYFFLQQFYNFLTYYSTICKSKELIKVEPKNNSFYTIRFKKDGFYSMGIVDFQLPPVGRDSLFCIVPWTGLLSAKNGIDASKILEDETLDSIIEEEIYPLLQKEFAKKHCQWIRSKWDFKYQKEPLGRGVVITMHSLYYEDNNGLF